MTLSLLAATVVSSPYIYYSLTNTPLSTLEYQRKLFPTQLLLGKTKGYTNLWKNGIALRVVFVAVP
jgi:hypothetical protein